MKIETYIRKEKLANSLCAIDNTLVKEELMLLTVSALEKLLEEALG